MALEILTVEPIKYNTIIVDEAQDFSPLYLIILSQLLKGHIAKGNYYFFGDFLYQGIFDTSVYEKEFKCYIEAMDGKPIDKALITNVRNSFPVQQELDLISQTSTKSIASSNSNKIHIYREYLDDNDQLAKIENYINILIHNQKVQPSQITILSRKHFSNSSIQKLKKYQILPYEIPKDENCITFSSIRKFKGLENDVIIVIDNEYYLSNNDLHILYVAISRAKQEVVVFETPEAKSQRESLLKK